MQAPNWDLSDLYKSPQDKQITADIENITQRAEQLNKKYNQQTASHSD